MLIAIDESGSFASATQPGSWCVVAAYAFPERCKTANLQALRVLKSKYGRNIRQEVKLRDISELDYFSFLKNLRMAGGALFAVATDAGLTTSSEIEEHRTVHAQKIRANLPRMKFDEGKQAVAELAEAVEELSHQLYVQLNCQVVLLSCVLRQAILYFVQRDPVTLRRFVWRIDQKNTTKTLFESTFERVAPGLLQSESFQKPMIFLNGADYSHFSRYEFSEADYPAYLQEGYGQTPQSSVNIGMLLRENMQFPDSKNDLSVQIADLLAAGVRRCLRGEFQDNNMAASLLGGLMVQNQKPKPPISLVHLSGTGRLIPDEAAKSAVLQMKAHARSMLST